MKKAVGIILGVVLLAPAAMSQEVLSANAVGYIKKTVNPGEFAFIQTPFVNIDGSAHTISTLLPDVPNLTNVLLWDQVQQVYVQLSKNFLGTWSADPVVDRGEAFFVQIPAGAAGPVDIVLVGEVPGTGTYPSTDIPLVEGFSAAGVPYPVAATIDTSELGAAIPNNNSLLLWDIATQGYVQVTKNFLGTWSPTGVVIEPGDGFFASIATAGGVTYTATAPYAWPTN
jgi:hypothetical protein